MTFDLTRESFTPTQIFRESNLRIDNKLSANIKYFLTEIFWLHHLFL